VPARVAAEAALADEGHRSSADAQGPAVNESLRHLAAGGLDDAREGRARHAHPRGRGVLVEALEVRKAQGLELVDAESHLFEAGQGDAGGLEVGARRWCGDAARAAGA
jgi:hypothetical protein